MKKKALPASLKKISYRDFDLSFRRHPATGKLIIKKDDEAVKQSVKNLVLTNRYERPFQPEFGGDIRSRLFDNFDTMLSDDYENMIKTTIQNFEPRASLDTGVQPIKVTQARDQNGMTVQIRFRNVASLNDVVLDINLNRVR